MAETDSAVTMQLPAEGKEIPLLLDSPHSGTLFPSHFTTLAQAQELLSAWDAWVDELWREAVVVGGSLVAANFPRVVIDPNRAESDIDESLLEDKPPQDWPAANPSAYSSRGMGLIRRDILPGKPMYALPLPLADVRWRLDTLYFPYHLALKNRLTELRKTFGQVWHINCHSMKSTGNAMNIDAGAARPDIVLGDRDGSSSEAGMVDLVETHLRESGLTVGRNTPYKGGYIVARYGEPFRGYHSLQIEINRAVYMDEGEFQKSPGFPLLQQQLGELCHLIAAYIQSKLAASRNRPEEAQ